MKNIGWIILFLFFLSISYGCGESSCNCDKPLDLRPLSAAEEITVSTANDFAYDLFARIQRSETPGANIFISPLSISMALAMTANGADGDTKSGILSTLHQPPLTDTEMNEAYKSLIPFLTNLDPKVVIELANSTWHRQDLHVLNSFRDILQQYYYAEVTGADFNSPATPDIINRWISDKTKGKITHMIDQIPAEAVMYLINAIYMKAEWQTQFDKSLTSKQPFFISTGQSVQADMMTIDDTNVLHAVTDTETFAEIPYGNGQFVMDIIMPTDGSTTADVTTALNNDYLDHLLTNSQETPVRFTLPKFKIDYHISLQEVLSAMGMSKSFSDQADFSKMFEEKLPLALTKILHQAEIEVDEQGAEAAAATVVEVGVTSAGPEKPTVRIDHPFIFIIREKHSKSILFEGVLNVPPGGN